MASLGAAPLQRYCSRIGLQPGSGGAPRLGPTLPSLASIHWAQLKTIPFENLSLQLEAAGSGVSTELPAVYSKLVLSQRGGYCFELNGLLSAVLRGVGFDVLDTAARVVQSSDASPTEVEEAPALPGHAPPPLDLDLHEPALDLRLSGHDHHVLLVQLDGRLWLADCGFGGANPPLPVLLPEGAERYAAPPPEGTAADAYAGADWLAAAGVEGAAERMRRFRLRLGLPGLLAVPGDPSAVPRYGQRVGYYLQHLEGEEQGWRDVYFFRLEEFLPQDFAIANHYIAEHPASLFRRNLIASRQSESGRATLLNDRLRVWSDGGAAPQEEQRVEGEAQLRAVLADHFGIEL